MAVRLNPRNAESTRQKIQTTQLVKRLQDHAFGKIEMSKTQVAAATFLINKRMPNPPEQHEHDGKLEVLIRSFTESASAQ